MQIVKNKINPYTIQLNIKESSTEYDKAKKLVLEDLSKSSNIKWFRKWSTIPEEVLISNYWEQIIENETIDKLMNILYPKILKKENIIPTWPAVFKELKSVKPFEIVLEVEVLPEFTINEKDVKKIKIKKQLVNVEQSEIDETIKEIEKKFTTFKLLENVNIELWDKVTLDTIWFDKKWWKEIPETKVKTFPLVIWSWSFIPGFEDKLLWAKTWEVVEFDITFPKDYHSKEFASRKVYFVTTIFSIEKPIKPEWTEDFIEKLRWVKTDFDWFKNIIKKEILNEKEYRSRLDDESKLLQELEKITKIELWDSLISHEVDRVFEEQKNSLENQWINLKHYLEHLKKDEETYKKEVINPEAIRRLKSELILNKLKEIIVVEVSSEEMQNEIEKIISQYSSNDVKEKLKEKLVSWDQYYEDIKTKLKYKLIIDQFFV